MSLLVRKINQSKWQQTEIENGAEISADAITICLKTTSNTLSTWLIKDEDQVDEAILAMASNCTSLDTIDIVILDAKNLEELGIEISETAGDTKVEDLIGTHRDMVNLTYNSLGLIADCIRKCFINKKVTRITKPRIKAILINAITSGRLKMENINSGLAGKLSLPII
jgi:hypothetical protein